MTFVTFVHLEDKKRKKPFPGCSCGWHFQLTHKTRLITMRSQPIVLRLFCFVVVFVVVAVTVFVVIVDVVFVFVVVLDVDIVLKATL